MELEDLMRRANRGMIAFDLALGTGTLLAPDQTLAVLFGHDAPSDDARELFRRCAPIWLTFAAAHTVAAVRDEPDDWWALAWLRATELFTDVILSFSPAIPQARSKWGLRGAGVYNLAFAVGSAVVARRA